MRPTDEPRIGVVGLGVVGGTIAAVLAETGLEVRGYDRYTGVGSPEELAGSSPVFICVPTPSEATGALSTEGVHDAVRTIESRLDDGTVVAIKSTIPPGTCDRLAEEFPRLEIAYAPEFLVQSRPRETFTRPDRIVVGARTGEAAALIADVLSRAAPGAPVLILRPIEAELTKLSANAMLGAKVALANELFEVCRRYGVAWPRVQAGVGLDRRIGPEHLTVTPERGFGGACLPKDLDGLIAAAIEAGHDPALLQAIAEFNRVIRREPVTDAASGEETADGS